MSQEAGRVNFVSTNIWRSTANETWECSGKKTRANNTRHVTELLFAWFCGEIRNSHLSRAQTLLNIEVMSRRCASHPSTALQSYHRAQITTASFFDCFDGHIFGLSNTFWPFSPFLILQQISINFYSKENIMLLYI